MTAQAHLVGWVALDENGQPYRKPLRGYGTGTEPSRIYTTAFRARNYSPIRKANPVYMTEEFPVFEMEVKYDN